jgi:hypothetical protein
LVYPEAVTSGSVSAEGDNAEQSKFLMLSSSSSVPVVSKWYQSQLKSLAWQIDKIQEGADLVSISGHKADFEINVMISNDSGKTTISVCAGKQIDNGMEDKVPDEHYIPDKANPPTD